MYYYSLSPFLSYATYSMYSSQLLPIVNFVRCSMRILCDSSVPGMTHNKFKETDILAMLPLSKIVDSH